MTSFLLLLLGSTRQGMVFPDPELGCGERSDSVNPLAKKVVQQLRQLQRPWATSCTWPGARRSRSRSWSGSCQGPGGEQEAACKDPPDQEVPGEGLQPLPLGGLRPLGTYNC